MSKTVKRVTRVMIFGLVAMLGATAEAHFTIRNGRGITCSHCLNAEGTEDPKRPVDPTTHFELIEYLWTIKKREFLCPHGIEDSNERVTLFVRKQVEDGDIARVIKEDGTVGEARVDVVARFSELPFPEDKCSDSSDPIAVLWRQAEGVINSKACIDAKSCEQVNSFPVGVCTLQGRYNLREFPKNLPPIGALLDCKIK